jgi:hypothetical protein
MINGGRTVEDNNEAVTINVTPFFSLSAETTDPTLFVPVGTRTRSEL